MKTTEELRFAALLRGRDLCKENNTLLSTIAEYPPLKILLDAGIIKIETARAINMASITSYSAAKQQTQNYMVDMVYMYQLRGAVKAHELNQFELEDSLSHPKRYITNDDDAAIGVKAEEIKNILKDNMADLTNIKDEDITLMENAIQAYNDILAAPKEAIDKRKAYGTDRINNLLNETDVIKDNIGKFIHSYFADLVPGWDQAIKVGKSSGVRHTSITIQFTVAGTELKLKNVKCTITNGSETFTAKSSALGWVRFYSLITDKWTATCELESFETYTLSDIETDDYHVERHNVPLQKKPD
jgi:hypothetical protein